MSQAIRHHYVPVFLLRAFADPATDDGQLYVLDSVRRKVFSSRPSRCGFRNDFNRVDPSSHPEPLVVEESFAKIEGKAAPVIQRIRDTNQMPTQPDRNWIPILFAMQIIRTPRFRRRLEGYYFRSLEKICQDYSRNKPSRRRFKDRQRSLGLPEDCWTPEGFIAKLKSGKYSVATDDNWKIAVSNKLLLWMADLLEQREWMLPRFDSASEPLIIGDAGVGLLPIGSSGPGVVGLARRSTVIYLPISPRQVIVGIYPEVRRVVETDLNPVILNSASFGYSLEQCYASVDDFLITHPDRGHVRWSVYNKEGQFPKLSYDPGDLADEYLNRPTQVNSGGRDTADTAA